MTSFATFLRALAFACSVIEGRTNSTSSNVIALASTCRVATPRLKTVLAIAGASTLALTCLSIVESHSQIVAVIASGGVLGETVG